jgi:hypothetical protein
MGPEGPQNAKKTKSWIKQFTEPQYRLRTRICAGDVMELAALTRTGKEQRGAKIERPSLKHWVGLVVIKLHKVVCYSISSDTQKVISTPNPCWSVLGGRDLERRRRSPV